MTQQAPERIEFARWIEHFEQNAAVHAEVDAASSSTPNASCRMRCVAL